MIHIREESCSEKIKNDKDNFEESSSGNNNSDKNGKPRNSVEDQSSDYDFFKQIPKNSFINAINYNNYFFGNNNPRDMKMEDFEVIIYSICNLLEIKFFSNFKEIKFAKQLWFWHVYEYS